ncbi:MAG: bifunctional DNA-formamidopyrimidine glycosylase/DNA-(apurinic or apyrimidinic site) lyase [Candidatus Beckwithbacteria bacterium]
MPELPEVETITRQLNQVLVGQKILSLRGVSLKVKDKRILGVERKAKMIIIKLSGGENLLIHLKMTGQLVLNGEKGKHTRQVIQFSKDRLIFNDLRKFGWIRLITNKELREKLAKLPPDVVDKEFTVGYLKKMLKSSTRAVKLVILDQAKLGGVGNIYANEALFRAGIDPRRPADSLAIVEVNRLYKEVRRVIKMGIKYGGTTASDDKFVNLKGEPGGFQKRLMVYENRAKCLKCKLKIEKVKLGGRGTYYCPKCQK